MLCTTSEVDHNLGIELTDKVPKLWFTAYILT